MAKQANEMRQVVAEIAMEVKWIFRAMLTRLELRIGMM